MDDYVSLHTHSLDSKICKYCGRIFFRPIFPSGRIQESWRWDTRICCNGTCAVRLREKLAREDLLKRTLLFDNPKICWSWLGNRDQHGYGRITVNRKQLQAHRYIYELLVGEIPEGLTIDHLCKNHACVNICHLDVVPQGVNTLRGDGPSGMNLRKTHCKRGHPFTPENIRVTPDGNRSCLICCREYDARWKREQRAEGRRARNGFLGHQKFSDDQVREIRKQAMKFRKLGKTGYRELAEKYGSTPDYISKLISGKKRHYVE